MKDQGRDGLIVIGGKGTLAVAHLLAAKYNIPIVGGFCNYRDIMKMCEEITEGNIKGKARASEVALKITEITGLETRVVVLGHIQRGGRPTRFDRIFASRLGSFVLKLIGKGESDKWVGIRGGQLLSFPLEEAIKPKSLEVNKLL